MERMYRRRPTPYEHAWEIRDAYGYHQYEDHDQGRKFRAFLHGRAWTAHAEGPRLCSITRWAGCAATGCCCRE